MDIKQQIGERIKALRKEKGLTSEKLAWYSDLSKACVTEAQKGTYDIKISTIHAICNSLGMSLAEFFSVFK